MNRKVLDYVKKNNMIEQGDRIVVGVSGGADSVCLLYMLREICRDNRAVLFVIHVNHQIRGTEADQDELFVQELCRSLGVRFNTYSYEVRRLAKDQGISEEEAGRNARYQSFLKACRIYNCNKIAVAHNKNDNAETVLFHLFRGTGIKGMSGMEPVRSFSPENEDIMLIRPFLCVEREEIEEYLQAEDISYRTDSTNLTEDYSRNKIRRQVLFYASKEINSCAVGNINETALKLKEAMEYIDSKVRERYLEIVSKIDNQYTVNVIDFSREPIVIQKGIIRRIIEELAGQLKDIEAKHIDSVISLCHKQVGKAVNLPYGMYAKRDYEEISLLIPQRENERISKAMLEPVKVTIPGETLLIEKRKVFVTELKEYKKDDTIPKSGCVKWFDYDKIENTVEIRNRREGDFIQINCHGGHKKLKDYFIDHKVPKDIRDSQLLITDGNHVMWIPETGERISERYKVEETTKKILLIKMFNLEDVADDR